jgi:hypothetical protein
MSCESRPRLCHADNLAEAIQEIIDWGWIAQRRIAAGRRIVNEFGRAPSRAMLRRAAGNYPRTQCVRLRLIAAALVAACGPVLVHDQGSIEGAVYARNSVLIADYVCTDALSGMASCTGPVASGATINTSTQVTNKSFTITARDAASNVRTKSIVYSVQ